MNKIYDFVAYWLVAIVLLLGLVSLIVDDLIGSLGMATLFGGMTVLSAILAIRMPILGVFFGLFFMMVAVANLIAYLRFP